MQFRLYYRGDLKADGNAKHKWHLRSQFHPQLQVLWAHRPLSDISKYIDPDFRPDDSYIGMRRGQRNFYPIVCERLRTAAEIDVLMMRPGDPGSILVGGGDIDNRLKTLLDSLKVPGPQEDTSCPLPPEMSSVFCLLEDDKLVTRVSVETDRLLDGTLDRPNEVVLIVKVTVKATAGLMSNIGIVL